MSCHYCGAKSIDASLLRDTGRTEFYKCGTVSPFGYRDTQSRGCRIGELEAAITRIMGWREIGHADNIGEKLIAIEDIARQVLDKAGRTI